jgi:predicted glycogen debranching enzyme
MPDFKSLSGREYLVTNGIGGYSSSSLSGANTRRYHGLLVASFNPPTERRVLVSKLEETLVADAHPVELSANQYGGTVHPRGFCYLQNTVWQNNTICFVYSGNGWELEKRIAMVPGQNKAVVTYTNSGDHALLLTIRPLLVFRDYHSLFKQNGFFDFFVERQNGNQLKIYPYYGAEPLFIRHSGGEWIHEDFWMKNIQYEREKERGFDFTEDAKSSGCISVRLEKREDCILEFSLGEPVGFEEAVAVGAEKEVPPTAAEKKLPGFVQDLLISSRQFVVRRRSTQGNTLIAGYHWFTDWGRDTMIAMRGISIAAGRQEEARSILQTFLKYVNKGMLPNRFPDGEEELEYNTLDATLWLFVALYEYHRKFGDIDFIRQTLPVLEDILEQHKNGTRYNIHQTEEGLLYGGQHGLQLTWMDARVDGFVVTPRIGCPVEINLLWFNAICIYDSLKEAGSGSYKPIPGLDAEMTGSSFRRYFINEKGYLNDVVVPGRSADESIRPNQVYALSLPFSPLDRETKKAVLACIETNLYTGLGLRTLDKGNPAFRPVYDGDAWQRDTAYHQGTVWPFLWGEWALAYLYLEGFSSAACKTVWERSAALREHFYQEGCLHAIAEIFDGLEPRSGKGCIQQAWSVAALLRVFLDERFDFGL